MLLLPNLSPWSEAHEQECQNCTEGQANNNALGKSHGGFITVEHSAPDGTVMKMQLPLARKP